MQHVKMLETRKGSNDGIEVRRYEDGGEYLVSDALAEIFVGQGSAELADAPAEAPEAAENDENDGAGEPDGSGAETTASKPRASRARNKK